MQLSEQERDFCCYYSQSGDVRSAAAAAGFEEGSAFLSGCRILQKGAAGRLIKRQRILLFGKPGENEDVKMALRRLVFCDGGKLRSGEDGVFSGELDLFGAVEVKQIKGGVELKLINKLSAIEQLYALETASSARQRSAGFFEALSCAKPSDINCTEGGEADGL